MPWNETSRQEAARGPGSFAARGLLPLAAVLLAAFLVYLPALDFGFLAWDDAEYVAAAAPAAAGFPSSVPRLFGSFHMGNYHPLTMLSLAADARLFRGDPRGSHATNVALHLANTALVWLLIGALGAGPAAAAFGALLFGVHPLQVESVAWVAERKNLLAALFLLCALLAYVAGLRGRRPRFARGLALACFLLALLSKAVVVVFPLLLLVVDRHAGRRIGRGALAEKAPYAALSLAFGGLALRAQAAAGALGQSAGWPGWTAPFFAAAALMRYLFNALLPVNLSAFYPYPRPARPLPPWEAVLALGLVALLAAGLVRLSRTHPAAGFGAAFFLLALLPVLQLVPFGSAVAADRYAYLPLFGLCYLGGVGAARLLAGAGTRAGRAVVLAGLAAAVVALGVLARIRVEVWRSDRSLWTDTVARQPREPLAWANRAAANAAERRWDEALADLERAFALAPPSNGRAYRLLGEIQAARGEMAAAAAAYDAALAMDPADAEARRARAELGQRRAGGEAIRRDGAR